jgi:(p)ppGpp synthase/HD superfamily hydrolase
MRTAEWSGIDEGHLYTPLLEAAMRLAAQAHYGQFRKREPSLSKHPDNHNPLPSDFVPYVTHLMGSACILARLGARDEVLAAALLHDYLEDVPDPNGQETIRRVVGAEVLSMVLEVTEDKRSGQDAADTWEVRKSEQIEAIAEISSDAVMIKAADLLHNLQSLIFDLGAGDQAQSIWDRFHADPARQLWYFTSALEACRHRLGDHRLVHELNRTIQLVEQLMP